MFFGDDIAAHNFFEDCLWLRFITFSLHKVRLAMVIGTRAANLCSFRLECLYFFLQSFNMHYSKIHV